MNAAVWEALARADRVDLVCSLVAMGFLWLLICGILLNFILAPPPDHVVREKRSPVATGAMAAFFVAMAVLSLWRGGRLALLPFWDHGLRIAGCAVIGVGTLFNIWGRFCLKRNWGNQVRIYDDHTLVTTGPYAAVRHPLYASTIWMLCGFGLLTASPAVVACTLALFVPMMTYRARQEEKLLRGAFGEAYADYCARTPRFFPKLWR